MPEDFWQYCWDMERDGTWGDHVTLQAAADAYGVPINILTSYQDSCFVNLTPRAERISDRALYVSFFAEVHYNSLYPAGVAQQLMCLLLDLTVSSAVWRGMWLRLRIDPATLAVHVVQCCRLAVRALSVGEMQLIRQLARAADPPAKEKILGSKTLYRWFGSRHQPQLVA